MKEMWKRAVVGAAIGAVVGFALSVLLIQLGWF